MDCQQLIVYGLLLLVGLYILKDVCGINLEGYENSGGLNYSDFFLCFIYIKWIVKN